MLFICISLVCAGLLTLTVFPFVIICLVIYCLQVILICIRNRLPDFSPKYPLLPINLGTPTFIKVNKNINYRLSMFFFIHSCFNIVGDKNISNDIHTYNMQCKSPYKILGKHFLSKQVKVKNKMCLVRWLFVFLLGILHFTRPWEWWWSESDNEI